MDKSNHISTDSSSNLSNNLQSSEETESPTAIVGTTLGALHLDDGPVVATRLSDISSSQQDAARSAISHSPPHKTQRSSVKVSHGGQSGSQTESHKWSCTLCTYDNWPRAVKCVMCHTPRANSNSVIETNSWDEEAHWKEPDELSPSNNRNLQNNLMITHVPNNRRARGMEGRWLEACNAVVDGNSAIVEDYLEAGGDPSRHLTQTDVAILNRPSAFQVGLTLIHLALRFQQENLLARLLSHMDSIPVAAKRVPSAAAPDLALAIRRHIMSSLRQPSPNFRCHVVSDIATFTLPAEIEEYGPAVQESVFDDVLDRDVQKELEEDQIINWSSEVIDLLNSRLYALWNRSAGDCLLDSVLQATWAVFDNENGLRQALAQSLQECATLFHQRWRDNENIHARLLHFSLNEVQCAADWAKLMSIASKPGSSLEQLHIFVLSHILRRPIIVYGVKVVKSFRGETLGYARYEGVYLPFLWEPPFCYKSPICLGYTRGHFSALVTMEPESDPMAGSSCEARHVPLPIRSSYLPLTSVDGHLLPIHFLTQSELGKEEMVMSEWLDVRYTETGLMVAAQHIQTPPLLVAQMREEWLNHYRPLP